MSSPTVKREPPSPPPTSDTPGPRVFAKGAYFTGKCTISYEYSSPGSIAKKPAPAVKRQSRDTPGHQEFTKQVRFASKNALSDERSPTTDIHTISSLRARVEQLELRVAQLEGVNDLISYDNRRLQRLLRVHRVPYKTLEEMMQTEDSDKQGLARPTPVNQPVNQSLGESRFSRAYSTPYSLPAGALSPPTEHRSASNFVSNPMPLQISAGNQGQPGLPAQPVQPVSYYYDDDSDDEPTIVNTARVPSLDPSKVSQASICKQFCKEINAESTYDDQSMADDIRAQIADICRPFCRQQEASPEPSEMSETSISLQNYEQLDADPIDDESPAADDGDCDD
ncbi:hypothetical protein DM02DRAFT_627235 [Periconia macrospinosa]|uniref:Uncharacterized protein n=1 Tax=Periconia macrospinosa TaxID=97972 RepID=A0A2V1DUA0_9PLEO|nr:hypothetical protein DM02DRAFT_627235 [Periconia macrospinosa]